MATAEERFWAKVDRRGPDECWPWLASVGSHGYGAFWDGAAVTTAHAFARRLAGLPVPGPGETIDHKCRNRTCVNVRCQRVISRVENVMIGASFTALNARKTACKRGHPFDDENTIVVVSTKNGRQHRRCRTCFNASSRARRKAESCG